MTSAKLSVRGARDASFEASALVSLLDAARTRHAEFADHRRMSEDVVQLMREAGIFRALVARRFGGDERPPADFLRLIERIAQADGSTGWVASFGFSAIFLASLPLQTLETIYADGPDVIFAGAIHPPQRAVRVAPGAVEVSGRWNWASGATGADLIGVGIRLDDTPVGDRLPQVAVMPADRVEIVRNWDGIGLKGSGSDDLVVDRVVVAEAWTFLRGGASTLDTPLYRYPPMALAAQVLAVVGLGVARAALDRLIETERGRVSSLGGPPLTERAYFRACLAKAEAQLRSARSFFYDITETVFDTVSRGDDVTVESRALLRLAATQAAHVAADVAQSAFRLSGSAGVASGHPIARHLLDAWVVPQHAALAESSWQTAGGGLLGLQCPPGFS